MFRRLSIAFGMVLLVLVPDIASANDFLFSAATFPIIGLAFVGWAITGLLLSIPTMARRARASKILLPLVAFGTALAILLLLLTLGDSSLDAAAQFVYVALLFSIPLFLAVLITVLIKTSNRRPDKSTNKAKSTSPSSISLFLTALAIFIAIMLGKIEILLMIWMIFLSMLVVYYLFPRKGLSDSERKQRLIYHGAFLAVVIVGGVIEKVLYYRNIGGLSHWVTQMADIFPGFLVGFSMLALLVALSCRRWLK